MKEEKRLSLSELRIIANEVAKAHSKLEHGKEFDYSKSWVVSAMMEFLTDYAQSPLPERVKPDKPDFQDLILGGNHLDHPENSAYEKGYIAGCERIWRAYVEPFGNNEQVQEPAASNSTLDQVKDHVAKSYGFIDWIDLIAVCDDKKIIALLLDYIKRKSESSPLKDREADEELIQALKYCRNKTYILVHTKNAVSKQCQTDLLKMRDTIESVLQKHLANKQN